jgi:hypothetical protein
LAEVLASGQDSTNDADVVICALDDVIGDGKVDAVAQNGEENSAHIAIAAGNLIDGSGSTIAEAQDAVDFDDAGVTVYITNMAKLLFDGEAYSTDGAALKMDPKVLVVGSVDCPECDFDWIDWLWCEDCEEKFIPKDVAPLGVAPLPGLPEVLFEEGGCPALMVWLANEIGVGVDIQVFLANAFAYSTDCQPCEVAARLKNAATILADEDGSHMAAMNQIFSVLAPDAPLTPEMAASIVTAFAGRANDGTQYAVAIEYIDAFVQYVAIVNNELVSPLSDPVAHVLSKYGTGLTENQESFVTARIGSGETFAQ